MNIILGILLIFVSVGFGYVFSDKFTKRKIFFTSFKEFNEKIKAQIGFTNNSLVKIIDEIDVKDDFYKVLSSIVKTDADLKIKYINSEELDFVKSYINQIMNSDNATLKGFTADYSIKILNFYDKSINDEKKYKPLYIKLSFLVGLIALIILL